MLGLANRAERELTTNPRFLPIDGGEAVSAIEFARTLLDIDQV
jgi:hypothetical protein